MRVFILFFLLCATLHKTSHGLGFPFGLDCDSAFHSWAQTADQVQDLLRPSVLVNYAFYNYLSSIFTDKLKDISLVVLSILRSPSIFLKYPLFGRVETPSEEVARRRVFHIAPMRPDVARVLNQSSCIVDKLFLSLPYLCVGRATPMDKENNI